MKERLKTMPISAAHSLGIIGIMAVCTLLTRAVPFVLFGGRKELPRYVEYLGKLLPPAVIPVLVVYCLKGIDLTKPPGGIPELICVGLVAALHLWKRNNLLSIGAGTVCYMFLIQAVFI